MSSRRKTVGWILLVLALTIFLLYLVRLVILLMRSESIEKRGATRKRDKSWRRRLKRWIMEAVQAEKSGQRSGRSVLTSSPVQKRLMGGLVLPSCLGQELTQFLWKV